MSSERRQRTKFVGVRLTPAEYMELAQDAAQRQVSIPAFIRDVLSHVTKAPTHPGTPTNRSQSLLDGSPGQHGPSQHQREDSR